MQDEKGRPNKPTYVHLNIRHLRREKKMSQQQLADTLGIGNAAVSAWENGKSYPSIEHVFTLSELFDVKIDDLFFKQITTLEVLEPSSNYQSGGNNRLDNLRKQLFYVINEQERELEELKGMIRHHCPKLGRQLGIL